jgi:hypothetical protein
MIVIDTIQFNFCLFIICLNTSENLKNIKHIVVSLYSVLLIHRHCHRHGTSVLARTARHNCTALQHDTTTHLSLFFLLYCLYVIRVYLHAGLSPLAAFASCSHSREIKYYIYRRGEDDRIAY